MCVRERVSVCEKERERGREGVCVCEHVVCVQHRKPGWAFSLANVVYEIFLSLAKLYYNSGATGPCPCNSRH